MTSHTPETLSPEKKRDLFQYMLGRAPMPNFMVQAKNPEPKNPDWHQPGMEQLGVLVHAPVRILLDPERILPILREAGIPVHTHVDMEGKKIHQGVLLVDEQVTYFIRGRDAWIQAQTALKEAGFPQPKACFERTTLLLH